MFKTLYTTKQEIPDTCTAVAFLTTRVRKPNKDVWVNLVHLMKYMRCTRDIPLILSSNDNGVLKWWIDSSNAVHSNMRGYTYGGLSMEILFPNATSAKQNLNTHCSTKSDNVGVHNCMPDVFWTRYFMEAQLYQVMENVFLPIQQERHYPGEEW